MRRLSNSAAVKAPASFALAYIATYFLERESRDSAKLALRFPLPNFLIDGLTVEKVVAVSLAVEYAAADSGNKRVLINWQPAGTRLLPSFSGTLAAAAAGEELCRLTIEGGYVPPGGLAGAIFDNLVGIRIARATLTALLAQLGQAIEADYLRRMLP